MFLGKYYKIKLTWFCDTISRLLNRKAFTSELLDFVPEFFSVCIKSFSLLLFLWTRLPVTAKVYRGSIPRISLITTVTRHLEIFLTNINLLFIIWIEIRIEVI